MAAQEVIHLKSALYTFVDSAYLNGRDPVDLCRQLCKGGSDLIQWRAKDWPKERIREIASGLRIVTREAGVLFVVNDHVDIARDVEADYCHLGQEDFFDAGLTHARELDLGKVKLGLSSHAPEQAERAMQAGADYIAIGPVYPTGTKPNARPVTLDYVRWARDHVPIPWFAIGGITLARLPELRSAGATRIAVVSEILQSPDIPAACRKFRETLSHQLVSP